MLTRYLLVINGRLGEEGTTMKREREIRETGKDREEKEPKTKAGTSKKRKEAETEKRNKKIDEKRKIRETENRQGNIFLCFFFNFAFSFFSFLLSSSSLAIIDYLKKQRDIYKFIHDQTLRLLNQGFNMNEIAESLKLPKELETTWSCRDYYGSKKKKNLVSFPFVFLLFIYEKKIRRTNKRKTLFQFVQLFSLFKEK